MHMNLDVDKIVNEVKSQGLFDEFRKESISDVDTKPAYQNLRQRVENSVNKFLSDQKWTPETNKNQIREKLRSNLMSAGFLDVGVQRIVDQVVDPKINTVLHPKIEDIVYKYLGIEKPERKIIEDKILPPLALNGNLTIKTDELDLLPNDLEAVSPDSDKSTLKSEPIVDSKNDIEQLVEEDDESPPFEPLERLSPLKIKNENSNDSNVSGLSGMISQDCHKIKEEPNNTNANVSNSVEITQESQLSQVSSNSHLSIVTNDEEREELIIKEKTNVDLSEEAQMPKFNENSNSHSPIGTENLHFDIKKDEIKFEGTDRNAESNSFVQQIKEENVNNLFEACKEIKQEQLVMHAVEEISNATLNTENSSLLDDDSEKGLQIVEEPTQSSIASQPVSLPKLSENLASPMFENLTESISTAESQTISHPEKLISDNNVQIKVIKDNKKETESSKFEEKDPNKNFNEPLLDHNRFESNELISNDISMQSETEENPLKCVDKKFDNKNDQVSENVSLLPPPSLYQSNGDTKSSSQKPISKTHSRHSSSSSQKKHSKDKKSDKNRDKHRKSSSSSSNDVRKHSSSSSSDPSKHSSSRHSSQSSTKSVSSSKDHRSSKSSHHKSRHYSSDRNSSKSDKSKRERSNHNEKSSKKSSKERSEKNKTNDDHSIERNKIHRRKSTDSNDGDTNQDAIKHIKKISDKMETTSSTTSTNVSNSANNTNDSAELTESEQKTIENNSKIKRIESLNLSKPIVLDNLNNLEIVITDCMKINQNNSKKQSHHRSEAISIKNSIPLKKIPSTKTDDSDESDLEFFEITPKEQEEFENAMNIFKKVLEYNENLDIIDKSAAPSNEITVQLISNDSNIMESTDMVDGKRKRKFEAQKLEGFDKSLIIDCMHNEGQSTKKPKQEHSSETLEKISPTLSEMSSCSKENDFNDKNGKILKERSRDFLERKSSSSTVSNFKGTQRYSSDDLYKPRPVLSQRSRRRGLDGEI